MWHAGVRENNIGLLSDYVTPKTRGKVVKGHRRRISVVGKIMAPPPKDVRVLNHQNL